MRGGNFGVCLITKKRIESLYAFVVLWRGPDHQFAAVSGLT